MKKVGTIATALLLLAPAIVMGRAAPKPLALERGAICQAPGQAVEEAGYAEIGGIRQWITIEGQDCANPVVLIVHGGPGNPNTPFAHTLFGSWTKDFTVVQ